MKLALITLVALTGLQNPPPSSWEKKQPPQNQTQGKQADTPITKALPDKLPTPSPQAAPNLDPPASQERAGDTAKNPEDEPSKEWWLRSKWIVVWCTGAMVMVGFGQFIMYWRQWCIMQSALIQTERIASKQLKYATASTKREMRAYVGVVTHYTSDGARISGIKNLPQFYQFFIKNTGRTPAYNVITQSYWNYVKGPNMHWPDGLAFKKDIEPNSPDMIGSATTLFSDEKVDTSCFFPESHEDGTTFAEAHAMYKKGEITLFMYGTITYTDIYRKPHWTNFCVVSKALEDGRGGFTTYHLHNDADHDVPKKIAD